MFPSLNSAAGGINDVLYETHHRRVSTRTVSFGAERDAQHATVVASLLAGWSYIAFQTWFPPFGRFSTTQGKKFCKRMGGCRGEGEKLFQKRGVRRRWPRRELGASLRSNPLPPPVTDY